MGNSAGKSVLPPLTTVTECDVHRFTKAPWFVIGNMPTYFETSASNAVEKYTLMKNKSYDIDIDFQYNNGDPISSKLKSLPQKGWLTKSPGDWKVSPFWPIKMPYPIIELDTKDYSYCVVGYPSRNYCWIMATKPEMNEDLYRELSERLVNVHGYKDLKNLRKVPQKWTREEREKRGLVDAIPDDMIAT